MTGLFQLRTVRDLLAKLEHDYRRLTNDPNDAYTAFDFFVTAEHMLDWIFPGVVGRPHRTSARDSEVLLQIVSHLATGAKHLIPEDPRHTSVDHADIAPSTYGEARYSTGRYGSTHLVITLDGTAAALFGPSITPLELAARVLDYWRQHPDIV